MRAPIGRLALCATLALVPAAPAGAQDLSDAATERAVRAAVRIQVDIPGGSSIGSGTMIDRRGYVLTNFHVVGFVMHGEHGGAPGQMIGDGQHVQIATVESDRDTARTRWIGRIVRADVRLDLALVRIVSQADGTPIPAGTQFQTVELGSSSDVRPGASLWCFGFPLGVRTINVTGGHMTGFQMNTRSEVAWIRTDAEFNPGNSGGMLVDRRGRLIAVPTAVVSSDDTLEPIEVARPIERIPAEWTQALARPSIDDVRISGILPLTAGVDATDESVGDGGALDAPEVHYFALPPERPGAITVTPSLPVALISPQGRPMRRGEGSMPVLPSDPSGTMLAVLVPRSDDGSTVQLRVRYELQTGGVGGYAAMPQLGVPYAYGQGVPQYGAPQYGVAAGDAVSVRGRLVDAGTGMPVQGMVLIGQPGVDLQQHITLFLAGRITDAQFESRLVATARTDPGGFYELRGVPRGSYPGAGMSVGYRPAMLTLTIRPTDAPIVDVNPIMLSR
jgi:serine protease Do